MTSSHSIFRNPSSPWTWFRRAIWPTLSGLCFAFFLFATKLPFNQLRLTPLSNEDGLPLSTAHIVQHFNADAIRCWCTGTSATLPDLLSPMLSPRRRARASTGYSQCRVALHGPMFMDRRQSGTNAIWELQIVLDQWMEMYRECLAVKEWLKIFEARKTVLFIFLDSVVLRTNHSYNVSWENEVFFSLDRHALRMWISYSNVRIQFWTFK